MKRLDCFSKRDFGGIVLASIGFAELIISIVLSLSRKINETSLLLGLAFCIFLFGIGYFSAYLTNARTRFRPCWYLSFGIFMVLIAVISLAVYFFELRMPSISLVSVAVLMCVFNFTVSFSASLQLRALCLTRWIAVALFGTLNAILAAILYFDVFGIKDNSLLCISLCLALFGIQTLAEPFYNTMRERNSLSEE